MDALDVACLGGKATVFCKLFSLNRLSELFSSDPEITKLLDTLRFSISELDSISDHSPSPHV